jgi:cyclophilin family peptidyl-prolyl cis-trans isomerase
MFWGRMRVCDGTIDRLTTTTTTDRQTDARDRDARAHGSDAMTNPIATFETTLGTFTAELYLSKMPLTVSNFINLANDVHFYDGLHFHRVIADFMLQFGCPKSKNARSPSAGTGGPDGGSTFVNLQTRETVRRSVPEGNIDDELIDDRGLSNDVGTLSMANTGEPNSGGSQFFINTVHNDFLDHWRDDLSESKHPVFGKVITGMDVVRAIERAPCDRNDAPITPVMMKSVRVQM